MSSKTLSAVALFLGATVAIGSHAAPSNAGFESGAYSPWLTIGSNQVIGSLGPLSPPAGSFLSLSQTLDEAAGAAEVTALEAFLGVLPGTLNALGNGDVVEGSAIKQTFSVNAGDILTFRWNFLTDEPTPSTGVNDFAFYVLDGVAFELADTTSTFVAAAGTGFAEQTGFRTLCLCFASPGMHTLAFGVADVGDNTVSSALLVDGLQPASVPEPMTLALLAIGLAALARRRGARHEVTRLLR